MRPLNGIRVLDFTHVLAGPFCTRLLADMGADVVKINSHSRAAANNAPQSPYYTMWNRNKRALALDMSREEARATAKELVAQCDVVIDNFSLGVLEKWSLGYEEVKEINDQVIYIQMSGMGSSGPWANFVTYAPTIHALSGMTHTTGVKGNQRIGVGFSYNDHQAGLHAAVAVLSAIESRRQLGRGQRIDFSQFEVGVAMLGPSLLDCSVNGKSAEAQANHPPYDPWVPHGCFKCLSEGDDILDEKWIAITCRDNEEWNALCSAMGNPDWTRDKRFEEAEERYRAFDEIEEHISSWVADKDSRELMYSLQEAGVPAGVVQTGIDLVETDEQLKTNKFIQFCEDEHPALGATFIDRLPISFSRTPCDQYERSRMLGEDNQAVLNDWLGKTEAEVKRGEEDGIYR